MKVAYGYFVHVHRQHWAIECYHRALKQAPVGMHSNATSLIKR
jgi:hypothetical protein